jgi:hypothetical protein
MVKVLNFRRFTLLTYITIRQDKIFQYVESNFLGQFTAATKNYDERGAGYAQSF